MSFVTQKQMHGEMDMSELLLFRTTKARFEIAVTLLTLRATANDLLHGILEVARLIGEVFIAGALLAIYMRLLVLKIRDRSEGEKVPCTKRCLTRHLMVTFPETVRKDAKFYVSWLHSLRLHQQYLGLPSYRLVWVELP